VSASPIVLVIVLVLVLPFSVQSSAVGGRQKRVGDGAYRRSSIVLVLVVDDCFPHGQQNDHDDEYDLSVGIRF
jgi:hypothetical protein